MFFCIHFFGHTQSKKNIPLPFLLISTQAGPAGTGDATCNSITSAFPIGIPADFAFSNKKLTSGLSILPWRRNLSDDMNFMSLSTFVKLNALESLAANIRYFTEGTNDFTNEFGEMSFSYKPKDLAIELSYIKKLGQDFSMSTSIKYIHSEIPAAEFFDGEIIRGNAVAADLGASYKKKLSYSKQIFASISLANLGPKIRYQQNAYILPSYGSLTVSYSHMTSEMLELTYASAIRRHLGPADSKYKFSAGIEANLGKSVSFRSGYMISKSQPESGNYISFGAGIKYFGIAFEISYWNATTHFSPFDNTFRYGLSYSI